ncbi:trypsin-like peptidase domain-containing protein [Pseudomonas sp. BW16M2]|uniref:trypsin-like serine peptidase n=1 Tax=Pseudomonas sp. BW16M2 TaxID=2745489 RepID=UPI001648A1CD|nr:serine protease [Pseudomonas sp. BW16M2]MBC3433826.1 trypsin-like peptidase domain-containing protein [Pseudomonas sp. BW16M2]
MPTLTTTLLALAMPWAITTTLADTTDTPTLLDNAHGEHTHWSGIGRLNLANGDQCIATLIDSGGTEPTKTGPAYLLTSGHCLDTRNGRIIHDQPAQGTITFNYFADTPDTRPGFALKRTLWSSMQGSDLALVELDASLAQVMAAGIQPLTMGPSSAPGSAVVMVGEASNPDSGLRAAQCTERDQASVTEFPWVWRDLKVNDCPSSGKGASGSAVIDQASGRLVSIVNSVPFGATQNNYAIPVQRVLGCFHQGYADLSLEQCALLPGFQITQQGPARLLRRLGNDLSAATWDLTLKIDTPRYRYKQVRDALECEDAVGYSGTISASERRIDDPIGSEPGRYYLCLVGVQSPEQRPFPALLANALSLPVEVIPAGLPEVRYTLDRHEQGHVMLNWQSEQPYLSHYLVKYGAADRMDCDNAFGYRRALLPAQVIQASRLPAMLCSRAIDLDGQVASTHRELLSAQEQ